MAAARFAVLMLWCAAALAADNAEIERRTAALANELRCLVCQNQTLADSSAPLAVDLRNQVREQLAKGASEREVVDFMVARYGDFVLYRPPFKASTLLLWTGPFLLLVVGIVVLVRRLMKPPRSAPELSGADRARVRNLLE